MVQTTNSSPDVTGSPATTGDWLDLRSLDGSPRGVTTDTDGRLLRDLRGLFAARAPERELIDGVKRARDGGWSWTPIAIVLDCSRAEVIRRFGRGIGHPSTRRRAASA